MQLFERPLSRTSIHCCALGTVCIVSAQLFEEMNKRCANHAFSRDIARGLLQRCNVTLSRTKDTTRVARLRVLRQACQLLTEARQLCSQSCVLMFFMPSSPERQLFDFTFKELETHTDTLQELVEAISKNHIGSLSLAQVQTLQDRINTFKQTAQKMIPLAKKGEIVNVPGAAAYK